MTREQFMAKEIATWGEDYIFDLLDRGYVVVEVTTGTHSKWTWLLAQPAQLTNAPDCATVSPGSNVGFTPVFPTFRASRTNAM